MEIGFFAAILIAIQIYAVWNVLNESWEGFKKLIWIIVMLMFPVVAPILYLLFFRTVIDK